MDGARGKASSRWKALDDRSDLWAGARYRSERADAEQRAWR